MPFGPILLRGLGFVFSADLTSFSNRCCVSLSLYWLWSDCIFVLGRWVMAKETKNQVWDRSLLVARKHVIALGEVVHASSLLQDSFYQIFSLAISLERPAIWSASITFHGHANAIWHSGTSDQQQREMAFAAISSLPIETSLSQLIKRLKWAKTKAAKLNEYRNLIAHNPITFRVKQKGKSLKWQATFGGQGIRPLHQQRIELIGGLRFWRTLRNDLLNLHDYVHDLMGQGRRIAMEAQKIDFIGVPKTWPNKPRLRSLKRLQEIDQKLSPAARSSKKRTRRSSSRRKS